MNIAVPASDLKKINARSIAVPGEPDKYIAGLSVYHELHCLVSSTFDVLRQPSLTFARRNAFDKIRGVTITFQIRLPKINDYCVCTQVTTLGIILKSSTYLYTDHCIDVLRQAILCHADPSLFTLQWSEKNAAPRADFSHEHQCVDWDVLNSWAAERRVPAAKMKHLEHPFGSK
jgi:hypothetical protein